MLRTDKTNIIIVIIVGLVIVFDIIPTDKLDVILIDNPRFTNWQISHFVLFALFGYLSPNQHYILLFGVAWEVFEYLYGRFTDKILYWTSNGVSGQLTDIAMNTLGFYVGRYHTLMKL